MLKAAIVFLFIGLLALIAGIYGVAGISIELGKALLFVFLMMSLLSFVSSMAKIKRPKRHY